MGNLHTNLSTCTISRSFLIRIRNVSGRSCRENQNTHFVFNYFFFWKSCRLWDNVEKYGTATQATDDIIWRMRFASWITKAADTHSENTTLSTVVMRTRLNVTLYCLSCSCQCQEHVSQEISCVITTCYIVLAVVCDMTTGYDVLCRYFRWVHPAAGCELPWVELLILWGYSPRP